MPYWYAAHRSKSREAQTFLVRPRPVDLRHEQDATSIVSERRSLKRGRWTYACPLLNDGVRWPGELAHVSHAHETRSHEGERSGRALTPSKRDEALCRTKHVGELGQVRPERRQRASKRRRGRDEGRGYVVADVARIEELRPTQRPLCERSSDRVTELRVGHVTTHGDAGMAVDLDECSPIGLQRVTRHETNAVGAEQPPGESNRRHGVVRIFVRFLVQREGEDGAFPTWTKEFCDVVGSIHTYDSIFKADT